jgi:hypothetical protein
VYRIIEEEKQPRPNERVVEPPIIRAFIAG